MKTVINPKTIRLKLIIFALFCGFGSFYPYLPMYYTKYLHFTTIQVGILTSLYAIMSIAVGPLWSMLADRTKRPKTILAVNGFITAIISLIVLTMKPESPDDSVFLTSRSFTQILLLISAFSFFMCPLSSIVDSIVLSDLSRLNDSQATYGRQRFIGSIAYGGCAYLMALLITIEDDNMNFNATFLCYTFEMGILLLVCLYWPANLTLNSIWLTVKRRFSTRADYRQEEPAGSEESLELLESPPPQSKQETNSANTGVGGTVNSTSTSSQPKSALAEDHVTWRKCSELTTFWLLAAVQGMALSVINNYLFYTLHREFGISDTLMGIVSICRILLEIPSFYWSSSAGAIILTIVGYFYPASKSQSQLDISTDDKTTKSNITGIRWVLVFSMFLLAIRVLLYVLLLHFRWDPHVIIAIDISHGVIYAIFYSSAVQTVALSTPEHLRASYQGIFAAVFSGIGPCLGSIVGGVLFARVGAVGLFLIVFVALVMAIVMYTVDIICCARRESKHSNNDQGDISESVAVAKTASTNA